MSKRPSALRENLHLSKSIDGSSSEKSKNVLDPWIILEYLWSTTDKKVQEYCVEQLYEVTDRKDADYFLPQLCSIFLSMDWERSQPLRLFLLIKCKESLHFALRTYWFLNSCSEYCSEEQNIKCEKLRLQVEISVVNNSLPFTVNNTLGGIINSSSPKSVCQPNGSNTQPLQPPSCSSTQPLKIKHQKPEEEQEQKLLSPLSFTEEVKDPIIDVHTLETRCGDVSMTNQAKDTNKRMESESPLAKPELNYDKLKNEEMERYLYKQRRCTFFTAQLELVDFLEELADSLKLEAPESRRQILRKNLKHANMVVPSGLYFPVTLHSSDFHTSVLRIIPESGQLLDSKGKVPFLFHYEVKKHSYPRFANRICDQLQKGLSPFFGKSSFSREKSPVSMPLSPLKIGRSVSNSNNNLSPSRGSNLIATKIERDRDLGRHLEKIICADVGVQEKRQKVSSPKRKNVSHKKWERKIKSPFPKNWEDLVEKYREKSAFYPLLGWNQWKVEGLIFKAGDDLRQEALAMQFICLFQTIFKDAKLPIQLLPYTIQVVSPFSGFVEIVKNAVSLSELKKKVDGYTTLAAFWEDYFGPRGSNSYEEALTNFVESLVGYSLVCYFLQVKDRHNGNILLDNSGRICHIDYGFMLSNSPGGNMLFETAPFKFQEDFITLLGGEEHFEKHYAYFQSLMIRGFLEARKHADKFCVLARIMYLGSYMACFVNGEQTIVDLRKRFLPNATQDQVLAKVMELIEESSCNWRTAQYDTLQRITNGIL